MEGNNETVPFDFQLKKQLHTFICPRRYCLFLGLGVFLFDTSRFILVSFD